MSAENKYRFTNKETLVELLDFAMEEFTELCVRGRDILRQTILKVQIAELQQELQLRNFSQPFHLGNNSRKSA